MTDDVERYLTEDEVRAEGRRLSGVAIRYGDTAQSHRERFEAGSLRLDDAGDPRLGTRRDEGPGMGARLVDSSWSTARTRCAWPPELPPLPAADKALEEVRAGRVTGLSIRFRPVRERMENGIQDYRGSACCAASRSRGRRPTTDSRVEARSRLRRIWL